MASSILVRRWREGAWAAGLIAAFAGVATTIATVPTTLRDFEGPGTQPGQISEIFYSSMDCSGCHSGLDDQSEPFRPWAASMMGQSARDPVFWAGLAIANQDAAFAGEFCLRCHAPAGWAEGRSTPTDGSGLMFTDFEGVSCHFCHRMVDPDHTPGVDPEEDVDILAALLQVPTSAHNAHFVVDPEDRRRGPRELSEFHFHGAVQSAFHASAMMCATCHDVSNPIYDAQPDGTYTLNNLDAPHPTQAKYDHFPIERTFSEWSKSAFAQGPVDSGGRFGGNNPMVSSCQDCHMPTTKGRACFGGGLHGDLAQHHFNGGNTWVLRAVRNLYPDWETFLDDQSVEDSIARARAMLEAASDMQLSVEGGKLKVRVINESGHKLPSGYPEGRRMWINVRFLDAEGNLVAERGAYDLGTAELDPSGTKVYEAKLGLDAAAAALTGKPEGPGFHFVLNNKWYKDNRIPPRGFTNAAFEEIQAAPVAYTYADGQHWDDTLYDVPAAARSAEVTVYYQTTSKEYIEFLRDTNTTNAAGQTAYDQWVLTGKSEPVAMDTGTIALCPADFNGNGALGVDDFTAFRAAYLAGDMRADFTGDGVLGVADFTAFRAAYLAGCP